MSLFVKGLGKRVSIHATTPRSISSPIRSPVRRVRQSRRHNSSQHSKPEIPAEGKGDSNSVENASSVNANCPAKTPESHTLPTSPSQSSSATPSPPSQPAGPAGTAAGAAVSPAGNNAVGARGFREIVKASPVGQLGRWYSRVQERKPYATQLWSSIIVYLCGDLSAQFFFPAEVAPPSKAEQQDGKITAESKDENEKEEPRGGYDPWRTVRHLIVGAGSSIPSYKWFMFLHNNFNYPSKFLSILTKVVVQQMCFTPVFNTYFFSLHSLLTGATLEETFERLKNALPVSITNSVKLWPAVTAFSFMYVPPQFRNVFAGCIAVGWQTYLSWLNQKAAREVLAAEMAAAEKGLSQNSTGTSLTGSLIPAAGTA